MTDILDAVRQAAYADSGAEPSRSVLDRAIDRLSDALLAQAALLGETRKMLTAARPRLADGNGAAGLRVAISHLLTKLDAAT